MFSSQNRILLLFFCLVYYVFEQNWLTDPTSPLSSECLAVGGAMGAGLYPSPVSILDWRTAQLVDGTLSGSAVRWREMLCKCQQMP